MTTKTFNEKLDEILRNRIGNYVTTESYETDVIEAKQAIIDLICETAEEAKPEFSGCVDCSDISVKDFQDNLINIVRGK